MLKKTGAVTAGITAALLIGAPFASAGESEHDGDHHKKSHSKDYDDDHGKKHHKKKHHKKHSDDGDQNGVGNIKCGAEGGGFASNNAESLANVGPVLSGNTGQLLSCNSFLNDVASHNNVSVLGSNILPG